MMGAQWGKPETQIGSESTPLLATAFQCGANDTKEIKDVDKGTMFSGYFPFLKDLHWSCTGAVRISTLRDCGEPSVLWKKVALVLHYARPSPPPPPPPPPTTTSTRILLLELELYRMWHSLQSRNPIKGWLRCRRIPFTSYWRRLSGSVSEITILHSLGSAFLHTASFVCHCANTTAATISAKVKDSCIGEIIFEQSK